MKTLRRGLMVGVVGFFLLIPPVGSWAQEKVEADPQAVITLLKEQNRKMSSDLRRIHREIAALRSDLGEPGIKDVAAGVGYIFGLFGVAAYVASRKKNSDSPESSS
ncbi:hypothetical protein Dvar_10170 [Desulfosarcina variabilis str. Montpellier]|uniref:hypothetical protein n=1 Tax=Desulfosarcina variabilis TaxID=2300 RepID=UPI003AFB7655